MIGLEMILEILKLSLVVGRWSLAVRQNGYAQVPPHAIRYSIGWVLPTTNDRARLSFL